MLNNVSAHLTNLEKDILESFKFTKVLYPPPPHYGAAGDFYAEESIHQVEDGGGYLYQWNKGNVGNEGNTLFKRNTPKLLQSAMALFM